MLTLIYRIRVYLEMRDCDCPRRVAWWTVRRLRPLRGLLLA